jgi:hypothetical protein
MDPAADFKTFFLGLTESDQIRLAQLAGTTVGHIRSHWVSARKVPRKMDELHVACQALGAQFSKEQLVLFFYAKRAA